MRRSWKSEFESVVSPARSGFNLASGQWPSIAGWECHCSFEFNMHLIFQRGATDEMPSPWTFFSTLSRRVFRYLSQLRRNSRARCSLWLGCVSISSAIEDVDPEALWLAFVNEVRQPGLILCASARGAFHCSLRGTEFACWIPSASCRRLNAVILEVSRVFRRCFEVTRQLGNTAQPVIGLGFQWAEIKDVDQDALWSVHTGALFFLWFGFSAVLVDFLLTSSFLSRCPPCHVAVKKKQQPATTWNNLRPIVTNWNNFVQFETFFKKQQQKIEWKPPRTTQSLLRVVSKKKKKIQTKHAKTCLHMLTTAKNDPV